jgi:hypothetical protein
MLGGGSKGTIAFWIASCALSARSVLVATFAVVLVFSSALSIPSYPFQAARSSRRATHISTTKVKVLSTTSEKLSLSCRAPDRRVTTPPCPVLISSPSHNNPQPIFRPLRC